MTGTRRASFCSHCGTALADDVSFCPECGTPRAVAEGTQPTLPDATPTFIPPPPVAPTNPPLADPAPVPEPAPRSGRGLLIALVAILVVVLVAGGITIAIVATRDETTSSASVATTVARPSTTVTTIAPTTSTSPPTTAPPQPTELQTDWTYDPFKCGVDFGVGHAYAHSSTRTYEATATTGLWSAPSTGSTLLITIPVLSYGSGGIGCPDGQGPYVTVQCKRTNGQTISGPFGTYSTWLRATYAGVTGFVPDQWVDTEWDVSAIPSC